MSEPRFLSAERLRAALPPTTAVDALERGIRARGGTPLETVPRTVLELPDPLGSRRSELLLMPAHGREGAGTKLVTIARDNAKLGLPTIQGVYVLFSQAGLEPELVIDGAALTGVRTAAVSGLATRYLARPDSARLVVFGAGAQALAHVEVMRALLPIAHTTIVGSSPDSPTAAALVRRLRTDGADAVLGSPDAVGDADVVCTCTTSTTPVFDGVDLAPGAHVNAVGAYRQGMCELDGELLARATLVVETEESALQEAGDVLRAIDDGALPATGFATELPALLDGGAARRDAAEITVFKSVGLAVEDLILARAAAEALTRDAARRAPPTLRACARGGEP